MMFNNQHFKGHMQHLSHMHAHTGPRVHLVVLGHLADPRPGGLIRQARHLEDAVNLVDLLRPEPNMMC